MSSEEALLLNRSLTLLTESGNDFLNDCKSWKANFRTSAPTMIPEVTREAVLKILFMMMVV